MWITIGAFVFGLGVGWVVCLAISNRRQRYIELQLMSCQQMLYERDLRGVAGNYDTPDSGGGASEEPGCGIEVDEHLVKNMQEDPASDANVINRLKAIILEHIADEGFGVEELSHEVGISRVHLNRKLKQLLNISPNQLILDIRMKYAASLLEDGKLNVGEVAFRLGFSSHSYFSSKFKDYFGVTPTEYGKGKI